MSVTDAGAGFFGKLTSHGDFVSRRLPPDFLVPWDAWLQSGLQYSRRQFGPRWLALYLHCPVWHFALAPGICGDLGWTGVLMSSVDRVGRHFPLTVAARAGMRLPVRQWISSARAWHDAIEDLSLSSLKSGFLPDRFDAALQRQPLGENCGRTDINLPADMLVAAGLQQHRQAGNAGAQSQPGPDSRPWPQPDTVPEHTAQEGCSFWWSEGSADLEPVLLHCAGLPGKQMFSAFYDGLWKQHGWSPEGGHPYGPAPAENA